ncbi:MAG: tyrosine--tRNA ligase [Desulfurococcaceae archaeon]
MDVETKLNIAIRNAAEVITREDLTKIISEVERPRGYIGFEPSGLVHLGWLVWMFKVRDLVDIGVDFYILEATWHALINDKLGGDIDLIRKAARYTREVLQAIGVEPSRVHFVDAEELVSDKDYWGTLVKIAKKTSLARVRRTLTIMGRTSDEAETDFSKLVYPLMQVTDIFYLKLDIALGGLDQRKAHMLARDLAERLGFAKPVAIHTPIISSLHGPAKKKPPAGQDVEVDELVAEAKMSKSKPETAIFIHDQPSEIKSKVLEAYCPPRIVEFNPIIEINRHILFQQPGFKLHVERPSAHGGPIDISSARELEELYAQGKIHPLDLKNATAESLVKFLGEVQKRLFSSSEAVSLLEELSKAKVTR